MEAGCRLTGLRKHRRESFEGKRRTGLPMGLEALEKKGSPSCSREWAQGQRTPFLPLMGSRQPAF